MTDEERTVWRCIWRQVAARNAAVYESYLLEDLHEAGMDDARAGAALEELLHSGHVSLGLEVGAFELAGSGWRLMARALIGPGVKVPSRVVQLPSRDDETS